MHLRWCVGVVNGGEAEHFQGRPSRDAKRGGNKKSLLLSKADIKRGVGLLYCPSLLG
jgi:hypothetical protein